MLQERRKIWSEEIAKLSLANTNTVVLVHNHGGIPGVLSLVNTIEMVLQRKNGIVLSLRSKGQSMHFIHMLGQRPLGTFVMPMNWCLGRGFSILMEMQQ